MTLAGFVAANLFRKPTRTTLTLASIAIAFLLYVLLRAIATAFAGGATPPDVQRIMIDSRYSMTDNLPLAHLFAIAELDQVVAATPVVWFGGYYRDRASPSFAKLVVDPNRIVDVFPDLIVDTAAIDRFQAARTAVLVAEPIAQRFGWAAGDRIPVTGDIWPKEDGSWDWQFELAGTYTVAQGSRVPEAFMIRHDYFDEAVAGWVTGQIGWIIARLTPGTDPKTAIDEIDGLFENSSYPTRSLSEDDYSRQFANRLGDIATITMLILGAVFFTLLLLTANVVATGFRERTSEFAVLKTLGYGDGRVAALVFGEALALCLLGALLGIGAAFVLEGALLSGLASVLGRFSIAWTDAATAMGIALALGLAIGVPPALRARRLPIVDALREEA
jgi:putative ABC transport system permease protein